MTADAEVAPSSTLVIAVIVTYSPDPARLERVVGAARSQTDAVILVDNAQGAGLETTSACVDLVCIDMGKNAGVAAAQNAGLRRAFASGASHVLLLDHDSVLQDGAVDALLAAWTERSRAGVNVAAVGANYRDPRRPAAMPFVCTSAWRYARPKPRPGEAFVAVSYLVSSGSLISREAFDAVGPMDERFFIDYVDIEWGMRAERKGWKSFGVVDAGLEHVLGDESIRLFGSTYSLHSPLRHYYMARNGMWLVFRSSLGLSGRVVEALRLLRRCAAYAVFAPKPFLHIAAIAEGCMDGVSGRLGARAAARGERPT